MDMQSDINIKTKGKYLLGTECMEWRTAASCYYWLPHSISYVNLTVILDCVWLRLKYDPKNDPAVDYIWRMSLTMSLSHFATYQNL